MRFPPMFDFLAGDNQELKTPMIMTPNLRKNGCVSQ